MNWLKNRWNVLVVLAALSGLLMALPMLTKGVTLDVSQSEWFSFFGAFHPLVLHLPIGFLVLVVSLEIYGIVTKKPVAPLGGALVLNALSAVVAALLGMALYLTGDWSGELIDDHMWQGLGYAAASVWLPWLYKLGEKLSRTPYYCALLFNLALMVSSSHHGGELIHGSPMDKAPWKLESKLEQREAATSQLLIYQDIVVPVLERKCYSCHSDKKQKGSLRVDTVALMLEGGEEDVALIKGDSENSPLITSIRHMPIDDDFHMPPENKPQITADELTLLEWWINAGAPEGKKLSELSAPERILELAKEYVHSH